MEFTLVVPGKPVAQKRPRLFRSGGLTKVYNPDGKYLKATKALLSGLWNREPIAGPLKCIIIFYMPIAKATSKIKRAKMISGEIKHAFVCDVDNLLKVYMDAMNTIVYIDDRQVFKVLAEKRYGEDPRTEITIMTE